MIPPKVYMALDDLGYAAAGEFKELDPVADNLLWRFVGEMIENCSRTDTCVELYKTDDDTCDDGNDFWYLIQGLAQGEVFLVYLRVASLSTDQITVYAITN